ncbi:MAG: AGE family epimerase/isomerase [Roseiflexaceae bacterium]|nr:AGE family epimerase/isomerase [Roseiflexaceae bacterium]
MLETYAERYQRDLVERVIPFWLQHSLDRVHGGYFTCLARDGRVYDPRKYVWLQGRAVWMFSRLYNELEPRQEFLDAATLGVEFLRRHARDAQGRVYFSLSQDGTPHAFQRKPYAAVFYQMGLFEYARASGDQGCLDESVDVFWRIVEWIRHPELLDRPLLAGQTPMSNLANLLVVGMMAFDLAQHFADPRYREVVRETIAGVARHYDAERRIFREHVALDGRDLMALPEGRLFNPGHSIETAWIMLHLLTLFPNAAHTRLALDALAGSLELGWDEQFGGILYFIDLAGYPTLQLEATMKLWWPHAEAIYALVLAATLTGEQRWVDWLERVDAYAYAHFVDPQYGEWFGYCNRQGDLALSSKGGNYKGFFHVPRALLFSLQAIERVNTP